MILDSKIESMLKSKRYGIFVLLIIFFPGFLYADSNNQIWPELNVYYKFNPQFRIRLAEGVTRSSESSDAADGFLETDLDFSLKLSFKRKLLLRDLDRNKTQSFRVGYSYVRSFAEDDPSKENRLILESTSRLPKGSFLLSDRNRFDFRRIDGEDSKRYRNRLRVESESAIRKFQLVPYAMVEFYYDIDEHDWNRIEYSFGSEFPILKQSILELYYLRQANSSGTDINAFGVVLQFHLGN